MLKRIVASLAGGLVSTTVLLAQGPVTNRMPTATMRGVIVEITWFRQQGAATVATPEQMACAKKRVVEGGRLGLLTDGDGLFQITGSFAENKFSKIVPFIGKNVDLTGAEVTISNNYDYKSFEPSKVVLAKKN
jgi:hypothetical protein